MKSSRKHVVRKQRGRPATGQDPVTAIRLSSEMRGWSQPVNATLYLEGEMECALMGDRFHRGFTAAEKTELWDRWKRGESLKAIGRAFGKPSSSIYFLVAPHGGIRPAQRRRSRLALTLAEREVISQRRYGTSIGTIHREVAWPLALDGKPGNEPQWRL